MYLKLLTKPEVTSGINLSNVRDYNPILILNNGTNLRNNWELAYPTYTHPQQLISVKHNIELRQILRTLKFTKCIGKSFI